MRLRMMLVPSTFAMTRSAVPAWRALRALMMRPRYAQRLDKLGRCGRRQRDDIAEATDGCQVAHYAAVIPVGRRGDNVGAAARDVADELVALERAAVDDGGDEVVAQDVLGLLRGYRLLDLLGCWFGAHDGVLSVCVCSESTHYSVNLQTARMVCMATELEQIRKRLDTRADLDRRDRERQHQLVKQRIAEGMTWDEVQAEAGISRPTLSAILHGPRQKRGKTRS